MQSVLYNYLVVLHNSHILMVKTSRQFYDKAIKGLSILLLLSIGGIMHLLIIHGLTAFAFNSSSFIF